MKKFLKTTLLFSSLLLFPIIAYCKDTTFTNNEKNQDKLKFSLFENGSSKVLYKTNIDVFKKHYSGLTFIKKFEKDSSVHVVFLSELGIKLFDFGYKFNPNNNFENEFSVHYCIEPIKKKAFINRMRTDFELLLIELSVEYKTKTKSDEIILISKYKRHRVSHYFNRKNKEIYKIKGTKGLIKRSEILFSAHSDDGIPKKITIKHKLIGLSIELINVNK